MHYQNLLKQFEESANLKLSFAKKYYKDIYKIGKKCAKALKNGAKIIFCGNGGSAADAQHLAAELVGKYLIERKALRGLAITTNTSNLTAIGNDYGEKYIFKRQIEALGEKGDILIAISTSGNSKNVIEAVKIAKKMGIYTIGFLGGDGGKLGKIVDFAFIVPSCNTPRIQETHITLGHILCYMIESELFRK